MSVTVSDCPSSIMRAALPSGGYSENAGSMFAGLSLPPEMPQVLRTLYRNLYPLVVIQVLKVMYDAV